LPSSMLLPSMRNTIATLWVLCLSACGGGPAWEGTWRFESQSCNGADLEFSGIRTTLTIDGDNRFTNTTVAGDCTATVRNGEVSPTGEIVPSTGTTTCSPEQCILEYEIQNQEESTACPGEFPLTGGTVQIELRGDDLYLLQEVEADLCELRFVAE
jgi:hypothetical protein